MGSYNLKISKTLLATVLQGVLKLLRLEQLIVENVLTVKSCHVTDS